MPPWYQNPEWWQVILIVVGTGIAWRSFYTQREAVRLTQRADIVMERAGVEDELTPSDLRLRFWYRNVGPTRAVDAYISVELFTGKLTPSGPRVNASDAPRLLSAGEVMSVASPSLKRLIGPRSGVVIADLDDVTYHVIMSYRDVFGRRHVSRRAVDVNLKTFAVELRWAGDRPAADRVEHLYIR